jgi:ABC-type lipoprotein release transport system permease subunit
MNILEAARGSPERKEKRYRPALDIVIVTVIFILIGVMGYFNENTPKGLGALAVHSVVETVKPILVLFLPFLLILSLSRVLILGIPGTLSLVAKPLNGLNKELHSLLLAGLKFGKRKIAIMAILISISLSFGILVLSQMETREASIDATIHASIPTDVYAAAPGNSWAMKENISSIEGASSIVAARGYSFSGSIGQEGYGDYFWSRVMGFDSSAYDSKVDRPSNIIIEGEGPGSLDMSSGMPGIIVNKPFTEEYDIDLGDIVNISMSEQWPIGGQVDDDYYYTEYYDIYIDFQVIGIVDHLPGLRSHVDTELLSSMEYDYESYVTSELEEWPCLYVDLSSIPEEIGSETWIYLVDTTGPIEDVEKGIQELNWRNKVNFTTTKERELQRIEDIPANKGMDLVLLIQFGCVLVSVIVGLFLLQVVSNASRKREFAEIMSRGATRENIFRLLLSEGIVVMTLGLVIGTAVGFLVGYSFQTVFTGDWTTSIGDFGSGIDIENTIAIENSVVFPLTIFIIHAVTIISSLATVLIVSLLSSKIDIASNLRLRRS